MSVRSVRSFLSNFLYHSMYWLFFSVVIALFHFWVGVIFYALLNVPLHRQALQSGSLLVFAITLTADAFGGYCRRIELKAHRWVSFYCLGNGLTTVVVSAVIYSLITYAIVKSQTPLDSQLVTQLSLGIAGNAVIYGLVINLTIDSAEGRLRC